MEKNITSSEIKYNLLSAFQIQEKMRGTVLMKEGEIGDSIYVLKRGYLKVEKNHINEKNIYY